MIQLSRHKLELHAIYVDFPSILDSSCAVFFSVVSIAFITASFHAVFILFENPVLFYVNLFIYLTIYSMHLGHTISLVAVCILSATHPAANSGNN